MRITFVLNHVNLNGGIRVIAIYADRLRHRGHQGAVVARPRPIPSLRNATKGAAERGLARRAKSAFRLA